MLFIQLLNYLSGVLTMPARFSGKIPAILFLRAFGANKDEVGNTFSIAAEKLFQEGIASLRIDFSGFGESKGSINIKFKS
jgi:fermentation-respiration switch protein FrsA (DUF1100 family)